MPPLDDITVIAPHFKRRLSGVTSTVVQLIPEQRRLGHGIVTLGPGLPDDLPKMSWWQLAGLWRRPKSARYRVWHARRNNEMLFGWLLRDVLRMPLKLLFTSASQRHHTAYTRWLISRMDAVVATSAKTAAYLTVPHTVIHHGIDTGRFHPSGDKPAARQKLGLSADKAIVGCFGRVRHQKGTDLFVDAMIRLLPDNPDWIAVIAGRATAAHSAFEAGLKQRVEQAGLGQRILFVGEQTNIPDWYRTLDLFVAPQRWEGFGLTPLEAMASGVPVVATDVGAFSELILPGETGRVVASDSLDALIDGIAPYLAAPALLEAQGAKALAHVLSDFAIEREVTALARVYARLADDSAGR